MLEDESSAESESNQRFKERSYLNSLSAAVLTDHPDGDPRPTRTIPIQALKWQVSSTAVPNILEAAFKLNVTDILRCRTTILVYR